MPIISFRSTTLSGDVLRRPWCAVEIGTAYLNKVPTADAVSISPDIVDVISIHCFTKVWMTKRL